MPEKTHTQMLTAAETKNAKKGARPMRSRQPVNPELTTAVTLVYCLHDLAKELSRADKRELARMIERLPRGILPASFKRLQARKGR